MEQPLIERFLRWCLDNNINITQIQDYIFKVDNLEGLILLLSEPEDDKRFDENFGLFFTDEEFDLFDPEEEVADEQQIKHIVFEFGQRFYFQSKESIACIRDDFNKIKFVAEFEDFKYIGTPKLDLELPFVHLGVHSEYELLNGAHNASLWVKKAAFLQQKCLGIADKNTLAGVLSFQIECGKKNIKSILGMTISVVHKFDSTKTVQERHDMKVYAVNEEGWQNLLAINRCINVDYDKFIPESKLLELGRGIIAIFDTNSLLFALKDKKEGEMLIKKFKSKFDYLFCQIDTVEFFNDSDDKKQLEKLKLYFTYYADLVEPVLINDSYYVDKEMYMLKNYLNQIERMVYPYSEEQHFKTLDESLEKLFPLFKDQNKFLELFEKMVANTVKIGDICNYKINTGEHKLPKYELVEGEQSNEEFFLDLLLKGFERKISKDWDNYEVYVERFKKEWNVIVGAGFVDYFLILWDIVNWARDNNVFVGVGRGSIGGCLLAFLLNITEMDPIKHDLLFERFLNEARISGERAKAADAMPDVDVDFEASERELVKKYIYKRFGTSHTCSIGAYTRLKLKAGIKDFGRVTGLTFNACNYITREIDDQISYKWKDLIKYAILHPEIKEFIQQYPNIAHCIKYSLGQARSASIHASAVIIVPREKEGQKVDIFNWMPIRNIDGVLVSEWEGKYIDKAGFLKEDILSLSQLDKFKKIAQLIERNHDLILDFNKIPLDDPDVYKYFQKGYTEDVFQFTSKGLKAFSKLVKPTEFEDLNNMNALFRPGPMESHAHLDYAKIKNNGMKPKYDYKLREVTEPTYGLYVFQEQIMRSVVVLGGFSLVEADILRTQIKKFDKVAMKESEQRFLKGAIKNGCEPSEAERIWKKLLAFSGYGYNKSHSSAYALMAYWCQWLKYHFPLEFWTASLNFARDENQIPLRLNEIKKLNYYDKERIITIKPPSLNKSDLEFDCDLEKGEIYWSILKIKGLGLLSVRKILEEKKKNGAYKNYDDFVNRVPKRDINKKHIFLLILAGVFDEVEGFTDPTDRIALIKKHFERIQEPLPEEFRQLKNIEKSHFWILLQRELTGFGDIDYRSVLLQNKNAKIRKLADKYISSDKFVLNKTNKLNVTVCGRVAFSYFDKTKNKKDYAKMLLVSNTEEIPVFIWSDILENEDNKQFIKSSKGKIVAISGVIKHDVVQSTNTLFSSDQTLMAEL